LVLCTSFLLLLAVPAAAADYFGRVSFNGLPVPGATVTATQRDQQLTTVTDQDGVFRLPALADGSWSVRVEMIGFAPVTREIVAGETSPASAWELKMLPLEEMTLTMATVGRVLSDLAPPAGGSPRPRRPAFSARSSHRRPAARPWSTMRSRPATRTAGQAMAS
jgi:hypothetical protein